MSIKTRLQKLEAQQSALVLVVLGTDQSEEDALLVYCADGRPRPDNVLFVITEVN